MSADDIAQFAAATGLQVLSLSADGSAVGFAWPQQVDRSVVEAFAAAVV